MQYNSTSLGLALLAVGFILRGAQSLPSLPPRTSQGIRESLSSLHLCLGAGAGQEVLGSVFFCLALNFKHIALYYATGAVMWHRLASDCLCLWLRPPLSLCLPAAFFFFLLRRCVDRGSPALFLLHVAKLGVAVVLAFAALWSPFCLARAADGEPCLTGLLHGAQLALLPCANTLGRR